METASRFALRSLGEDHETGNLQGACAVCGSEGSDHLPREKFSKTFCERDALFDDQSNTVCPACNFFSLGTTWQAHIKSRPDLGLKSWATATWRCYSHFFRLDAVEHPGPSRWREILDAPPEAPFLAIIAESAMKNLVPFGVVATDADAFPVLLEHTLIWVRRDEWAACRDAFEALRAIGMGRDSVLSGDYNQAAIIKAGFRKWHDLEAAFSPWRLKNPNLCRLVHYTSVSKKS